MAEIVNLRQARKRRERDERAHAAAENRIRFGRTKGEKAAEDVRRDRTARDLDGHRLDDGGDTKR